MGRGAALDFAVGVVKREGVTSDLVRVGRVLLRAIMGVFKVQWQRVQLLLAFILGRQFRWDFGLVLVATSHWRVVLHLRIQRVVFHLAVADSAADLCVIGDLELP